MRLRSVASGVILMLSFVGGAHAQEAKAPAPVATVATVAAAPGPEKLVLREGADVNLKFAQDLSSKTATEDDPVNLLLDQDFENWRHRDRESARKSGGNNQSCQESRNDG